MFRRRLISVTVTFLLLASIAWAQEVRVIGASLSEGYALSSVDARMMFHDLDRDPRYRTKTMGVFAMLKEVYEDLDVRGTPTKMFFTEPLRFGKTQASSCNGGPDGLTIGIDFLIWYGYGVRTPEFEALIAPFIEREQAAGEDPWPPAETEEWRLAAQAEGLDQLERVLEQSGAPLVIGDYPNMADADPRMLPKIAIPKPKTLEALNARLHRWAADRPRVHVFPLAEMVVELRKGISVEIEGKELALTVEHLMQHDKLHPTRLGVAYLTVRMIDWLRKTLPEDHAARPPQWTLEELIEIAEAEEDLEAARHDNAPTSTDKQEEARLERH